MENLILMPKISFLRLRKILISVFVISIAFSTGYFLGEGRYKLNIKKDAKVTITREVPVEETQLNFSLFWRVWDTLESNYFDKSKINKREMVYGAIKGMVASLGDPYTVFLSPSENKVIEEDLQGNFEGVGIQLGFKGTRLTVIAPLPNSPAEKAGVKAGDYIVGIKDEKKGIDMGTVGISLDDAVQAIRGSSGSKVTLAIVRDKSDEIIIKDLIRSKINVPSIVFDYQGEDKSIAYIQLLKFGAETKSEWDKVVIHNMVKNSEVKGIVLDLRNNPGGYLQSAVEIAQDFVNSGQTIVIEEGAEKEKTEYKSETIGRLRNIPTVVLVNQGSASASEILAGALRDLINAKLVGETTFGKGTIQEPLSVDSGASLHLTTSKWLTPKGTWVDGKGLEPDVKIEDNSETEKDEQLDKAIEVVSKKL